VAPHRLLLVLLATVAIVGVTVASAGNVTMSADRSFVVSTTDDQTAYLGFQQTVDTTGTATNLTVDVTNQYPPGTTLTTLTVTVGSETQTPALNGGFDPGERVTVEFTDVDCTADITVDVSGSNESGTLVRPVDC
jgi:cell division protein FtsI/penicillin-binding protein 2